MIRLALIFILLASPAFAQQQQPSPEVQALLARIQQEIQGSINCAVSNATLQQELAKLKLELESLRTKGGEGAK